MKRIIISIAFVSCTLTAGAQSSIDPVLRNVESNNKELRAARQLATSQKIAAGMSNNLPDPVVNYAHVYGNHEGMGISGELVATQSFDFPTLYFQRNKLNKAKGMSYDHQSDLIRQQVLLQAKEACLDLVYLNQLKGLLKIRKDNAVKLSELYRERLKKGTTNILEMNKIDLELLNVKNEERINAVDMQSKLQELAMLNGGEAIHFGDTTYSRVELPETFNDFKQEAMASDRRMLSLRSDKAVALREIAVNKSQWLPELTLGYKMTHSSWKDRFNGFVVGFSIPLFSNRNSVKQAKATAVYTDFQMESLTADIDTELSQLYHRASIRRTISNC